MESEKLSLRQQLSKAEKDLQAARKEIEKVIIGVGLEILPFSFSFFLLLFHFDFNKQPQKLFL